MLPVGCEGVLTAVEYLNNFGIVHRAVSPSNIYIKNLQKIHPHDIVLTDFSAAEITNTFQAVVFEEKNVLRPTRKANNRERLTSFEPLEAEEEVDKCDVYSVGLLTSLLLEKLEAKLQKQEFEASEQAKQPPSPLQKKQSEKFYSSLEKLASSLLRENYSQRPTASEALMNPIFGSEVLTLEGPCEALSDELSPVERQDRCSRQSTSVKSIDKLPSRFMELTLSKKSVSTNATIQYPSLSSREFKLISSIKMQSNCTSLNNLPSSQSSFANLPSPTAREQQQSLKFKNSLHPDDQANCSKYKSTPMSSHLDNL